MTEIVCKDAIEYIDSFADESIDLIVLDPDYQDWDKHIENGILQKCMRVLKPTGNILAFTKQPFDFNLRVAADKYFRREICWTFENGGAWCSKKMPLISTQKVYWLVKQKQFYFNPRTGQEYNGATKDFKRKTKVFGDYTSDGRDFKKSAEGTWLRDHLHINKPNSGAIPAKPRKLIEILLRCFCPQGGCVLDPFAGSGTVPQVCNELGCECFACDIQEERVMQILDRLFAEESNG